MPSQSRARRWRETVLPPALPDQRPGRSSSPPALRSRHFQCQRADPGWRATRHGLCAQGRSAPAARSECPAVTVRPAWGPRQTDRPSRQSPSPCCAAPPIRWSRRSVPRSRCRRSCATRSQRGDFLQRNVAPAAADWPASRSVYRPPRARPARIRNRSAARWPAPVRPRSSADIRTSGQYRRRP